MPDRPKIGAFVLETLTTGMYANPLDTVREFVQNAIDSILQAEPAALPRNEGRIEIQVRPDARGFAMRDNGLGIPSTQVHSRLINIGMSSKSIAASAGFRGIGRLAAIAYCRTLTFRTAAAGERVISTVQIDCESLRQAILPAMRQVEELADVMARHSTVVQEDSTCADHFFEVAMEGISETADEFLDWQLLERYLSQVAPVRFDAQRFLFAPKITEWVGRQGLTIPTVTLVIRTPSLEREVFKPYKSHYRTQHVRGGNFGFHIKDIAFYPESVTSETPFWLWYAKTDLLGTIEDEQAAGFRLRAKNISIGGPERVAELFADTAATNSRFNAWYVGEIHVVSPRAIPNARRDGFESTGDWPQIRAGLMPFIRERVEEIRQSSQARNRPVAKIERAAEDILCEAEERKSTGFVSPEQRDDLIEQVVKQQTVAREAARARQGTMEAVGLERIVQRLEEARLALEQENRFVVRRLRSDLDRKQRKLVCEILEILYQTLDEENYRMAEAAILTRFQVQVDGIDR